MIKSSCRRAEMFKHKFLSWIKKGKGKGVLDYRMKNSEKFMYILDTTTLFVFDAVACAQSSSWKGSPWCKAENPRYKCQVRLSAFHRSPSFLFTPLVFRHRGRNCLFRYPSMRLYLLFHSLFSSDSRLSFVLYFQISSSNTSPFLPARNFDSSRFLSSTLIPISIILNSSP